MAKPVLIINGHDYAEYIEELEISRNDLDADGSGRDVQTGLMFRTRIAIKTKIDVKKTTSLPDDIMRQIVADINPVYFNVTYLDPETNANTTKVFYTSGYIAGVPRYDRGTGRTRYDGVSFSLTER